MLQRKARKIKEHKPAQGPLWEEGSSLNVLKGTAVTCSGPRYLWGTLTLCTGEAAPPQVPSVTAPGPPQFPRWTGATSQSGFSNSQPERGRTGHPSLVTKQGTSTSISGNLELQEKEAL